MPQQKKPANAASSKPAAKKPATARKPAKGSAAAALRGLGGAAPMPAQTTPGTRSRTRPAAPAAPAEVVPEPAAPAEVAPPREVPDQRMQLLLTAAQDRALKENRVETGRPAGHVVRALVQMWMDDTAGTRARVERVLQEERRQADRWD